MICTTSSMNSVNSNKNLQNRHHLSFSGKKFVQMNLFGEKYLVPRKVADVRRSVKSCMTTEPAIANVVGVKQNLFLGIAHIIDKCTKIRHTTIGKYLEKIEDIEIYGDAIYKHKKDKNVDLGVFWTSKILSSRGFQYPDCLKLIKFAKTNPKRGEDIYIVGYHDSYIGPKVIRAIYKGKYHTSKFNFGLTSELLANKGIVPTGMSGAAVVNKHGELVGVISSARMYAETRKSDGYFEAVDINNIRKFLESNKVYI